MTATRRSRLRSLLAEHDVAALLVTSLVNVRYLTGFTGSYAQLLVDAGGDDVLVTDGRYAEQAQQQAGDVRIRILPPVTWIAETVPEGLRFGVETHILPWAHARRLQEQSGREIVALPPVVEDIRQVKDAEEIAALRRACGVADEAFAALVPQLRPDLTEKEVAVRLERLMVDLGADDRAFETIVASGPNSAIPHHRPTARRLQRGQLVKFDFGARVAGYHSDMTRMVALGDPEPRLREVFDVVRRAQQAGLEAATDGAQTGAVDAACRAVAADAGFGKEFVHGTGHGVGLEIHEDPYLRPEHPLPGLSSAPSVTLRAGMTVTVEPGVYLPGVGGVRIEDSLVITAAGPDVLTRTGKDLVVL